MFALISPSFLESGSSMDRILIVGIGAMILGIVVITSYKGTLLDYTQNRFKEYFSVVGYKIGEWATLPDVSKIKVVSSSYIHSNTPNGISPTLSGKVTDYKLFMYSNAAKPFLTFDYSDQEKAVTQAKELASSLHAELVVNIQES